MMSSQRAINLLCQMYLPYFDDEEKDAITMAITSLEMWKRIKNDIDTYKKPEGEDFNDAFNCGLDTAKDIIKKIFSEVPWV